MRTRPARLYAGRSPDQRADERRARLIAAGLELFGTFGYGRVSHASIGRLCAHARVTARHFYEAFASREALLRAVYDRVIDDARAAVVIALAHATTGAPDDTLAQIRAGVTAFVHSYLDDPRHVRIACVEVVGVSAALEAHRREVMREFAGLIRAFAERALRPRRDWSWAALALAGGTNELLVEWTHRREPPPAQTIIDEVVSLYSALLR